MAIRILIGALVLLVIYVLSVGPAARMVQDGIITHRTYDAIYGPIRWVVKRADWVAEIYNFYLRVWHNL